MNLIRVNKWGFRGLLPLWAVTLGCALIRISPVPKIWGGMAVVTLAATLTWCVCAYIGVGRMMSELKDEP